MEAGILAVFWLGVTVISGNTAGCCREQPVIPLFMKQAEKHCEQASQN